MATWLVTRHAGATEWLRQQGYQVDQEVIHLDAARVSAGDLVIGTLPLHLAAAVCERGARFLFLAVDIPAGLRGTELSAAQLKALGARLEAYAIQRAPDSHLPGDDNREPSGDHISTP